MSKTVTLMPSAKSFQVQEGETVLAAALRQGIHLPYGCRTGSCGTCRAHCLEGKSHYPEGAPLALTALQLDAGETLLCRAVPETDLKVEASEITAMAALRVKAMPCRVARLEKLTHDVMGLYLRLPAVERMQFLQQLSGINVVPGNVPAWFHRDLGLASPFMNGDDVTVVQKKTGAAPDGVFGPITQEHVISFQSHHGLAADGIVGPLTARALGS